MVGIASLRISCFVYIYWIDRFFLSFLEWYNDSEMTRTELGDTMIVAQRIALFLTRSREYFSRIVDLRWDSIYLEQEELL